MVMPCRRLVQTESVITPSTSLEVNNVYMRIWAKVVQVNEKTCEKMCWMAWVLSIRISVSLENLFATTGFFRKTWNYMSVGLCPCMLTQNVPTNRPRYLLYQHLAEWYISTQRSDTQIYSVKDVPSFRDRLSLRIVRRTPRVKLFTPHTHEALLTGKWKNLPTTVRFFTFVTWWFDDNEIVIRYITLHSFQHKNI